MQPNVPPSGRDSDFDIFISYSRRDSAFVDRLHRALERYTPPKGLGTHPGRLRVFRDTQDFRGSEYFSAIEAHLSAARKLVLVCSPDAAASTYVNDETERFIRHRGSAHVIPVLWRGLPNNEAIGDRTDQRAFPPALERSLAMPLAADFRGLDAARDKVDDESHHGAWMLLLANILDVSRADVEQREQKRRRARRRLWTGVLASAFAVLLSLTLWALFEGERALARQLAAQASLRGGMELDQVERRVLIARDAVLRHQRLRESDINADTALRDAVAHAPRRRLALPATAAPRVIAFSHDGEHLLSAEGSSLRILSLATATEVAHLSLPRPLSGLESSPDASFIEGTDSAGERMRWTWPDLRSVTATTLDSAPQPVSAPFATSTERRIDLGEAKRSHDGHWALTLEPLHDPIVPLLKPTRIDIVDVQKDVVVRSLADHADQAEFAPDGETVVSISGRRLRLWDRRDGRERLRLHAASTVERVLFDRSSRQVAAIGADGSVEVFEIGTADEHARWAATLRAVPMGSSPAPLVGSGQRLLFPASVPGALPTAMAVDGFVQSLQPAPTGRFVVVGVSAEQPFIQIGEPPGMELLLIERTPAGPALRYRGPWGEYRFDLASETLLVADRQGDVRRVDVATGRILWERRIGAMQPPPAAALTGWRAPLAFADDASVAAVAGPDGIVLLSGANGQTLRTIPIRPVAAALSKDGQLLARNATDDRIEVRRTSDDSLVGSFDWREVGSLRDLMFSPGGRLLLAVGGTEFSTFMSGGHFAEEHVVAWSLDDGTRVARVPESMQVLAEYQEKIGASGDDAQQLTGVVWNRHTREFAGTLFPSLLAYYTVPSGMVRGTLVSWQLDDDGVKETYRAAAAESVRAIAFAESGSAVVVSGEDGYRRSVDLRRDHAVNVSCGSVIRPLSDAERRDAYGGGWQRPLSCP